MAGDDFPAPAEGFVLTHFIVAEDVARSRDFYTGVLGGQVVMDGEPTIVKLANGWVIINVGGGPLLHARPRRPPDRGRSGGGGAGGAVTGPTPTNARCAALPARKQTSSRV